MSNRGNEPELESVEIQAVRDEGFYLDKPGSWTGWAVKYRKAGTRRWTRFKLIEDPGQTLSVADVERAVEAHRGI